MQIKWFNRKFDFTLEQNVFPAIIERLEGTSLRIEYKIRHIPLEHLTVRKEETWSIQENLGHLIDLEPLWQGRLTDILNREEYLRPTDLENKKTDFAKHNEKEVEKMLKEFRNLRQHTLDKLKALSEKDIYKFALHPRLKKPMRTMDLFLFVAEHDDHHLARVSQLNKQLTIGAENS